MLHCEQLLTESEDQSAYMYPLCDPLMALQLRSATSVQLMFETDCAVVYYDKFSMCSRK
jgi:hypothetical protein